MNATRPAEILRHLEQSGAPDADLLARFVASRDASAFAELVRRHGALVLGVCRRVTGHPQDAEDAFQAVFLVLAQKAGALRNGALLGNWLYGVAFRVARRAKRSAVRRRTREVTVATMPEPPASPATGLSEVQPILDEELAALPDRFRDAIVLCDLRGASRGEAAAALGIPEGTLSSRLANGRKKLAARLTKRGVALSAAALPLAVAEVQASVAISNELVLKTCGLVAGWANGGAVPTPLVRLAEGGVTVRKVLVLCAVMAVGVAGAVFAAQPRDESPPTDPQKPVTIGATPADAPQPKVDAKPAPAAYSGAPRLRAATDIKLSSVTTAAWSKDGQYFAVQGYAPTAVKDATAPAMVLLGVHKGEFVHVFDLIPSGNRKNRADLVGFTPDGRELITQKREHSLVSGFHWLRYEAVPDNLEYAINNGYKPTDRTVNLDLPETHGYAFAADGKTFRTVAWLRDANGAVVKLEVLEVETATGKAGKSLLKLDYERHMLAPNGKRLAVLDKDYMKVTVYDLDRGTKQFESTVAEEKFAALHGIGSSYGASFSMGGGAGSPKQPEPVMVFSPDARRLVVSRAIGQIVVLNAETGEALPALDGLKEARIAPDAHCFSGDGRLLAASGTMYKLGKQQVPGPAPGGKGRNELTVWEPGARFLTVWDTQTGKAVKSWNRSPQVMFHPAQPVLAILEHNGESGTRVGFWDFAAEAAK